MIDIAEISRNLHRRLAPGPNICVAAWKMKSQRRLFVPADCQAQPNRLTVARISFKR